MFYSALKFDNKRPLTPITYKYPIHLILLRFKENEKAQWKMEYDIIEKLNKSHVSVKRGDLMIPILKLNLFDNDKAMNLDLL